MKLLFDGNLSNRIVPRLIDLFAESTHIKAAGLDHSDDSVISDWAKQHGFTIVSKDTDFYQRSIALGHPPKLIREFIESEAESVLVLERPA